MNKFWLLAAVAAIFSLSLSSCKDSDTQPTEQQKEEQMEQEASRAAEFWSVVGQLTDDVMPQAGWQQATYAPSIGEPDGANDAVRVVACNDAEEAARLFADLVGLTVGSGFDAATADYTYTNPAVGTLHYRQTGGSSLSTVDVDIAQMPGLSQIVFKSPEQLSDNGSFDGTAYYRFGDVVMKQNTDGQWDYWICVRPCFGLQSKGDSHWITLSKIPAANLKNPVNKTVNGNKLTHIQFQSLCSNTTHMQNLAELLYAMMEPDTWAQNLENNYTRLQYLGGFDYKKNYKYHNKYFFENVANAWPEGLYRQIFGLTKDELAAEINQHGLNLIYNTNTMSGNNILVPVASYTGTNLKTRTLSKKSKAWTTESFNIHELSERGYVVLSDVGGGPEKAFLARYATGATLAKGSVENPVFDKYKRLPNCRDVFVYNIEVDNLDINNLKNIAPKEAAPNESAPEASKARNDAGTYMIGDVLADEYDNRWFCIAGSPRAPICPGVTENTAYFISFDFNDVNTTSSNVQGLPTEQEAVEVAAALTKFFLGIESMQQNHDACYIAGTKGQLGSVMRHVLTYADVDIRKISVSVDSTWTFTSGDTYHSVSTSHLMNFAYDDGHYMRQAIMRVILDYTQAGSRRTACQGPSGKTYADWRFLYYKHYENITPPRLRDFTNDERALSMNEWCLPWRVSADKMYLQDVADQDMVDKYAAKDKWVTLPLATGDETTNARRKPRTKAETTIRPSDYIGKYDTYDTQKTNLFNEPVMFFRVLKISDNGGKKPNLVSQDGRELHVVHLQNDANLYNAFYQALWAHAYNQGCPDLFFIDNVQTPMPQSKGWQQ